MKKNGFTLMEVLLVILLLGVIAAITLPTFTSEQNRQICANTLSTAISDFENAMGVMMMREGVESLFDTEAWSDIGDNVFVPNQADNFSINLRKVIDLTYNSNQQTLAGLYGTDRVDGVSGTTLQLASLNPTNLAIPFKSKKGVVYAIYIPNGDSDVNSKTEAQIRPLRGKLAVSAATVIIDVNAANPPNTIARDIFMFELGEDGVLYPYGGQDVEVKRSLLALDWEDVNAEYTCNDETKDSHGFGCTARLIQNGFTVDY